MNNRTFLSYLLTCAGLIMASGHVQAQEPSALITGGIQYNVHLFRTAFAEGCVTAPIDNLHGIPQWNNCSKNEIRARGTPHNQKWYWIGVAKNANGYWDTLALKNTVSGYCISVENNSASSEARVIQQPCDFNNPSQLWMAVGSSSYPYLGKHKLVNVLSGKCLVPKGSPITFVQSDCPKSDYINVIPEGLTTGG